MNNILKSVEIYNRQNDCIQLNIEEGIESIYNHLLTKWYFKYTDKDYKLDLMDTSYGTNFYISKKFDKIVMYTLDKCINQVILVCKSNNDEEKIPLSDILLMHKTIGKKDEDEPYENYYDNVSTGIIEIQGLANRYINLSIYTNK